LLHSTFDTTQRFQPPFIDLCFILEANYPNPFNAATWMHYALPTAAAVRLTIYNLRGELVCAQTFPQQPAGYHTITWDGTDNFGAAVNSGIYLYQIESANYHAARKMLLLR
jgi:hypothetical protein